jgi:hypothetical protein
MAEEKRTAGFVESLERDHLLACSARRVRERWCEKAL